MKKLQNEDMALATIVGTKIHLQNAVRAFVQVSFATQPFLMLKETKNTK